MIELSSDLVSHVNDVASLEKEEAAGETHNLVLILQREQHLTRPQAIETIRTHCVSLLRDFTQAQAELPALCSALHLDEEEETSLLRYADLMATMIRGNYDWSHRTHRYGTTAQPALALSTADGPSSSGL